MKPIFKVVLLGLGILVHLNSLADPVTKALENDSRSEQDQKTDLTRKPAEFMHFLAVKPGMTVLDIFSGGGYYTEIASLIVGQEGEVHAHNNKAYVDFIGEEKLSARYQGERLPNVVRMTQEANSLSLKSNHYDRILLVLSFHDLYYIDVKNGWPEIDADTFMNKVKSALKPDGLLGIIDHDAKSGTNISSAQSLHRIDPQIIKDKMLAWGFKLKGESEHLKNAADPMDIPMWEESIRGKTNKSVMKFGK